MLVATPGQTSAYVLHNNSSSSSNITTTASNILSASSVTSVTASVSSSTSSIVTTKKQQAVLNKLCAAKETPKCLNNYSTLPQPSKGANSITAYQNNHKFNAPSNKRDTNNIVRTSSLASAPTSATKNNLHSLSNSNSSSTSLRAPSFLSTLKDTVQKALVTTATSLSKNGGSRSTASSALNSSNVTSINNISTTSALVTSSSLSSSALSGGTTKNSSTTTVITTATSISSLSSASSSTTLPLTVARKKLSQAVASQPKLHTIPPTPLHRYPEERQKASSTDSLHKEMCHFKPIRTVPTTPWKSSSKSRGGNHLKFPIAKLATNKSEFILKSNCDVNNRKKKSKQTEHGIVISIAEESSDNEVQENNEYLYKPTPSTFHLSASFLKQNHQSAFVCLVANLINMQSPKLAATSSRPKLTGATKGRRAASCSKGKGTIAARKKSPAPPANEILVHLKQFKSPLPPSTMPAKRLKLSTARTPSRRNTMLAKEPSNMSTDLKEQFENLTPSSIRLRRATTSTTSKAVQPQDKNSVKVTPSRLSRKRKSTTGIADLLASPSPQRHSSRKSSSTTSTSSSKSPRLGKRSTRLISESYDSNLYIKYPKLNKRNFEVTGQRDKRSFSPPLTRLRLKQFLNEQKTQKETQETASTTPDAKKRKG